MFWRRRSEASTPHSDDSRSEKARVGADAPFLSTRHIRAALGRRRIVIAIVLLCFTLLALALGLGLGLGLTRQKPPKYHTGPNVLVIMTDDQDVLLDSMSAMPNVKRLIGEQGVTFDKHYCTVAWCCPSRVNFLTGRAAHNTNVTSTGPPYGGWQKFTSQGLNDKYLPTWIQDAGIRSYYVGKLMNGYSKSSMNKPSRPKGWTNSTFLVDPWTYNYYHSRWTDYDFKNVTEFKGQHTTDVTETKASDFLDQALSSGDQWFMMVAPVAPHQEIARGTYPPPVPAAFRGNFSHAEVPKGPNWNPDVRSGASWVYNLEKLNETQIQLSEQTHRHRLGNIAAIDVMVANFIKKIDNAGALDNTYIIYTTDNGFHIGNHRLLPGKRCPYEEDINIPLLIRGPGMPKNTTSNIVNSHTDMAPTILQMLGVPLQDDFDGAPIAYTSQNISQSTKQEIVSVEFWNSGGYTPIGFHKDAYYNNTYKALRLLSDSNNFYYSTWCTGEREFYDMNVDSAQMNNRLAKTATGTGSQYYGRSESDLFARLEAVLMVTKSCKQDSCRNPWGTLFPSGEVTNIQEAMDAKYDTFFTNQPHISFSSCSDGNVISEEGPQQVNVFGSSSSGTSSR